MACAPCVAAAAAAALNQGNNQAKKVYVTDPYCQFNKTLLTTWLNILKCVKREANRKLTLTNC